MPREKQVKQTHPEQSQKWPDTITLIRHDVSAYNESKKTREAHPLYQAFRARFDAEQKRRSPNDISPYSQETRDLAQQVYDLLATEYADFDTPLSETEAWHAKVVGAKLKEIDHPLPDVIYVSPYLRTRQTLERLQEGWPELKDVKVVEEDRIREQDTGLTSLYGDKRVFEVFHPEQGVLRRKKGEYWYTHMQGENVPMVRDRIRQFFDTLIRNVRDRKTNTERNVLVITHHLTILAFRANIERFGKTEFERIDKEEKPLNCGVTIYKYDRTQGERGKLVLDQYNAQLY